MDATEQRVRIVVDASGAEQGAKRFGGAMDSISAKARSAAAANDNYGSTLERLGARMTGTSGEGSKLGGILDAIKGKAAGAAPEIANMTGNLMAMGGTAAIIGGVALAIGAVAVKSIDAASKVEIWKANLLTVTGSAQKAQDSYAALVGFASRTPFDLGQSVEGYIKLRTLGLKPTEAALTSFGNTSAAMGKSLTQMIEAVADAATGEFERLKEFGIKSKQTGDTVAFTFQGVTTKVKKNASDIQAYLEGIGNTKFAGAMDRQMNTITGAMSNVQDAIFQMFAGIGQGQLGESFKNILKTVAAGVTAVTPLLSSIGNVIGSIVGFVGKLINGFFSLWSSATVGGRGLMPVLEGITAFFNLIAEAVGKVGDVIGGAFSTAGKWINDAGTAVSNFLGLNKMVGTDTASWTDLVHASWEMLGEGIESAKKSIGETASSIWDGAKTKASEFGTYLTSTFPGVTEKVKGIFSGMGDNIKGLFEGLDFSPAGIVRGAARVVDLLIGTFRGGINVIGVIFSELPGTIYASLSPGFQTIVSTVGNLISGIATGIGKVFSAVVGFGQSIAAQVASVFNAIGSFIEKWINKAISGLNFLIGAANKLGAGIEKVGEVKISGTAPPKTDAAANAWSKFGNDIGAAFNKGFGHGAENFANSLIGRANGLSKKNGSGGLDAPNPANSPNGSNGKKDGGGDAANKLKQEDEFWKKLEGELQTSKLFGLELEKQSKELELQKILGRALSDAEKTRVDSLVAGIATGKQIGDLKKSAFELDNQTATLAERTFGLTTEQAKIQDAIDAKKLAARNAGIDINDKEYQSQLAIYKLALQRNQAQERLNTLQASALASAKKYSPLFAAASALGDIEKERKDFLDAFTNNRALDELGQPLTRTVRDAVLAGMDQAAAEAKRKPLMDALGAAAASSVTAGAELARLTAGNRRDDAMRGLRAANLDPLSFAKASKEIADNYRADMYEANSLVARDHADKMRQKFGEIADILGRFGSLIGGKLGKVLDSASGAVGSIGDFSTTHKKTQDSIVDAFGSLGKDSKLVQGIGKAVGGAMAGLEIGEKIGELGKAIGVRGSETGAKIGGAIGGLTGNPLIAAGASIIGGLISSLFFKPKSSNGAFTTDANGNVVVGQVSGSNAQLRGATSSAAGEVLNGLNQIASQLGGKLTGVPNETIGTWDGRWRVLNDQITTLDLHSKNFRDNTKLIDFGDDQAAAVKYAITVALKQGVVTGLSDIVQKALAQMGSDAAITFAQQWAATLHDFNQAFDPVTTAVKNITLPLDSLRETMVGLGASTTDLTRIDQLRQKKLDDLLKQQTKSIDDILSELNGDLGGFSKFQQLQNEQSKLSAFRADLLAGKQVDQDALTTSANRYGSLLNDLYGTQTQDFQTGIGQLRELLNLDRSNIVTAFNSAAATSFDDSKIVQAQADTLAAQNTANEYLAEMAAGIRQLVTMQDYSISGGQIYGGKLAGVGSGF